MKDCSAYWALADYLPLNVIVQYWCEKSGYRNQNCQDAMAAAIVAACDRKLIQYGRDDGKTFDDTATSLANRGILTIHRESFDAWVMDFEDISPLPEKPLGATERNTLLVIIAALCKEAGIDWSRGKGGAEAVSRLTQELGTPISDDTIRAKLKEIDAAIESRQKP